MYITKSAPRPTPTAFATLVLKWGEITNIIPMTQQIEIKEAASLDLENCEKE